MRSLRLSVTDRCNLRCHYCMPEDEYLWLPREDVLTFEEIARLADLLSEVGVERLRITGGEPLMRRDVPELVGLLASRAWVRDLALTTNGVLLAEAAGDLKKAGLHRLTVSLDTLRADRFHRLTRINAFDRVIAGIDATRRAGFTGLKLDTVVTRGDNDDELIDLVEFARQHDAEVRFIEYMDVGGATKWRPEAVVSRAEILARLTSHYGPIVPAGESTSGVTGGGLTTRASCRKSKTCGAFVATGVGALVPLIFSVLPVFRL